jgi:N6-L-threonylcarbamoyladenine synthase
MRVHGAVHESWGGVVPRLAQEAHRNAIDMTVEEALRRASVSPAQLTAIAVTVGPGLSLCLEVGVRKAIALSTAHQLPLVRVHHMEAHAIVTWLPTKPPPPAPPPKPPAADVTEELSAAPAAAAPAAAAPAAAVSAAAPAAAVPAAAPAGNGSGTAPSPSTELSPDGTPPFPFLTLLVSGGHNMLVLTSGLGSHTILGSTLDDSIGEAFDKTARLLGITAIPGGAHLEMRTRRDRSHTLTDASQTRTRRDRSQTLPDAARAPHTHRRRGCSHAQPDPPIPS